MFAREEEPSPSGPGEKIRSTTSYSMNREFVLQFARSEAGSTEPWAKDSTAARDGQRHGERHSFAHTQGRKTGRAARTVHSRPTPSRPVPGAVQSQTVA